MSEQLTSTEQLQAVINDENALSQLEYCEELREICEGSETTSVVDAINEIGDFYITVPITLGPVTIYRKRVYLSDVVAIAVLYGHLWAREDYQDD